MVVDKYSNKKEQKTLISTPFYQKYILKKDFLSDLFFSGDFFVIFKS